MLTPVRKDFPQNMARIIPAVNVRIQEAPTHAVRADTAEPTAADVPCQETEVVLLKDGDRVKTIVITCACGRVISLDCAY
jgi:hypothetical protein